MALNPEQIAALRDAFGQIAAPITDWLLQDAAERIALAGKMTSTANYELYRAKALGESQRALKKYLKRQLKLSNKEIRRLFCQAARMSRGNDEERVGLTSGADMEQMTAAAVKLAQKDFSNLTQTLGMMAPDGRVLPLRQFYQKTMDFAFGQIFTGAADYQTAIRQATSKMADAGVRTIDYKSGISTDIEAAVRRNMMGGMGLLDEKITQVNHDALGCNGWEVSAHANSAPDHEPYQGHQYSDAEWQKLNGTAERPGTLKRRIGTLHCGHVAFPIIMGVNSPQYTKAQLQAFQDNNAKGITYEGRHYTGYEATQKQRQLERAQRKQKRRILVAETTGDALKEQAAQIKLQMLRQHYKAFSKAADLPLQEERTWVAGFGHSAAVKARAVAKKQNEKKQDGLLQTLHITPQPITMESIQSVRTIVCDTLDEDASHRLKTECKQLLMFARKQPEGVETGRLYDLHMNPLTERLTGEATGNRIRLPDLQRPYVALHTHPDCAILSHGDLLTFTKRENARMIIALGHDGHCYAAEKADNYDGISALSVAVEIAQSVNMVTKGASTAEQYLQKVIEEIQTGEKKMEQYGVKFYEW